MLTPHQTLLRGAGVAPHANAGLTYWMGLLHLTQKKFCMCASSDIAIARWLALAVYAASQQHLQHRRLLLVIP